MIALVPMDLSKHEFVIAQNDNTLGQDGDGNSISQSEMNSQSTDQGTMCISGQSTSLSCNNLSSESTVLLFQVRKVPKGRRDLREIREIREIRETPGFKVKRETRETREILDQQDLWD